MATCSLSNRHQLEKVVRGFFDPELFLDDMRYFVLFEDDGDLPIKKIAVEITSKLKASTTVDWQVRDSVRARLRNLVRRLLRKYKYPPDQAAEAIELVMKQVEALADVWSASD